MTDEKYIQNQRKFIKRERGLILRDFWQLSILGWLFLVLAILFAGFNITSDSPHEWEVTTITLESHKVYSGRRSKLVLFAKDGRQFRITEKPRQMNELFVDGRQYTFVYSSGISFRFIEELKIDGVEYINLDDSIAKHNRNQITLWIITGVFVVLSLAGFIVAYKISTWVRKDSIKKYKKRIKEREKKQ